MTKLPEFGENDIPPQLRGITGRTGGSKWHDNAAGPVRIQVCSVDEGMDGDHGGGILLQQGAVVERKADLSENRQVGLQEQHAPLVDVVHTSFDQCDGIGYPFRWMPETQPPQVDPHDGYVAVADMGRCAQDMVPSPPRVMKKSNFFTLKSR